MPMDTELYERMLVFFGAGAEWGIHGKPNDLASGVFALPAELSKLDTLWARNKRGAGIYVRPGPAQEPFFILVDDINAERLRRQHGCDLAVWPMDARPGRLIVESSPGNHQVWIRSRRPLDDLEKRAWLSTLGSDPGAAPRTRWGRLAGFANTKAKHQRPDGSYPLARLLWVQYDAVDVPVLAPDVVERPTRARAFIVVKEEEKKRIRPSDVSSFLDLPRRQAYERGDESAQDLAWCLALMRRGLTNAEVAGHLHTAREAVGWGGHHDHDDYVARTVEKARRWTHAAPPPGGGDGK